MKLQFAAVELDYEVQRLGGSKGLATASTKFFSSERQPELRIELEDVTGLVTITHSCGEALVVPRERVRYFVPVKAKAAEATPVKK